MLARLLSALCVLLYSFGAVEAQDNLDVPVPTEAQMNWQNAELVAVFHYDLHVFDGEKYVQRKNRITPIADYNVFNPKNLDTDQWIKSAKAAGCKIAILTATHETGFALYQSDVNPYSLKSVKWKDGKGDIVRDFVNSCHKYGVKPGIYIGIRWNSFYGIHDFKVSGDDQFAQNRQQQYNRICEGMVDELCSRYGELAIVWFDGGAHGPEQGGPDVLSVFDKHQPNCLFYHNMQRADIRWGGSETGTVPYPCWSTYPYPYSHSTNTEVVFKDNFKLLKHGDKDGEYWMPAMSDAPLRGYNGRHEWFWEPGDEKHVYPLDKLVDMYYKSVGRNSTLILGLTPNDKGLLPQGDVKRLKEFGDDIRKRFSNTLGSTEGDGSKLVLKLKNKTRINQILLKENISNGERVRNYIIEAMVDGKWKKIANGECVGHKRVQKIEPVVSSKFRLRISESNAEPQIKEFSVYWVDK
ncbi:MAG: alpha-L-fucosidase [Bacteroidota bacterium]